VNVIIYVSSLSVEPCTQKNSQSAQWLNVFMDRNSTCFVAKNESHRRVRKSQVLQSFPPLGSRRLTGARLQKKPLQHALPPHKLEITPPFTCDHTRSCNFSKVARSLNHSKSESFVTVCASWTWPGRIFFVLNKTRSQYDASPKYDVVSFF
jgi:hypothetical protein